MLERFTDDARRVLVLAQEESKRLGHGEIDIGHIVLAVLTTTRGRLSIDTDTLAAFRKVGLDQLSNTSTQPGADGHIPFTPAAKATLEGSTGTALRRRHDHISDEDLLLAALDQPAIAEPLADLGIDLNALRGAARTAGPEDPDTEPEIIRLDTDNDMIVSLLQQILARLDTITERLDRDQ